MVGRAVVAADGWPVVRLDDLALIYKSVQTCASAKRKISSSLDRVARKRNNLKAWRRKQTNGIIEQNGVVEYKSSVVYPSSWQLSGRRIHSFIQNTIDMHKDVINWKEKSKSNERNRKSVVGKDTFRSSDRAGAIACWAAGSIVAVGQMWEEGRRGRAVQLCACMDRHRRVEDWTFAAGKGRGPMTTTRNVLHTYSTHIQS